MQQAKISREVSERLLAWYDRGHRDLPWRGDPDPYHVWISEIMLQQTRVEAVKRYYERFLAALPTIRDLADCPEEKLLKLWEGLGYYSRVRNLQKAAQVICETYDGRMPAKRSELLKLPGIGAYTSAAISSICFGKPHVAVDGNVLRVVTRLLGDDACVSEDSVKKRLEEELTAVIPSDRPGDFNQALMELGACVCLPNAAPKCSECPWEALCLAHRQGNETDYPVKAPKKARTIEEKTVLVIRDNTLLAIHKRPAKGLLAGLYELPCIPGKQTSSQVQKYLSAQGIKVLRIEPLGEAKHIFTHKEWHMTGYLLRTDELEKASPGEDAKTWIYVSPQDAVSRYAIPSAFSAYYEAIRREGSPAEEPEV